MIGPSHCKERQDAANLPHWQMMGFLFSISAPPPPQSPAFLLMRLFRTPTPPPPPPPPATPALLPLLLGVLASFELLWIGTSIIYWRRHFSHRTRRLSARSPSFRKRPSLREDFRAEAARMLADFRGSLKRVLDVTAPSPRASLIRESTSFSPSEAFAAAAAATTDTTTPAGGAPAAVAATSSGGISPGTASALHAHAMRRLSLRGSMKRFFSRSRSTFSRADSEEFGDVDEDDEEDEEPSSPAVAAEALDMNHVRLSLAQYVWGAHFVAVPSILLLVIGFAQLLLATVLRRLRLLRRPTDAELHSTACDLLLESSLAIQFQVLRAEESGDQVGSFVWTPFPFMVDDAESGDVAPAGREGTLFSVDVDLTRRKILKATLNEERLGLADLVALLAHALAADQHPKVHAYANWAIDPDDGVGHPYLRRTSVVTALYNHFGKANAPWIMGLLLSKGAARELDAVFEASLAVTPPPHAEVRRLVAHSRLVRFIVRLRGPFMRCFDEHREAFPASYSAEAYRPASWHRRRRRS